MSLVLCVLLWSRPGSTNDFDGESTIVETFVWSLRKKLEGEGTGLIHTVRGVGYRMQAS